MADPDFAAMARDELGRALTLSWRELASITPWGDSFEGVSPAGREVIVARSYIWRGEAGGVSKSLHFDFGLRLRRGGLR